MDDNLSEAWCRYHDSLKCYERATKAVLAAERALERRRDELSRKKHVLDADEQHVDNLRLAKSKLDTLRLTKAKTA